MDACLIKNHLPDFSFMPFIATLQLGLHDCHNSTRKCWNKLKTLHTIQSLVWQWNARENQNFIITNVSNIQLCISCYAGNGVKGNANITYMVSVALGKRQIAQQLLGHHCSVRSGKQTAMAENSFDWSWCARCTKTLSLSKSGFKHANFLLSLTRCQSIPASVPSSICWMNARYEATTVDREMWITYKAVCIIIH